MTSSSPSGVSEYSTWGGITGMGVAEDEAVGAERPQGLRQHLLAHALDGAAQLVPAQGAAVERYEHEHAPLAGDVVEHDAARAVAFEHAIGEDPAAANDRSSAAMFPAYRALTPRWVLTVWEVITRSARLEAARRSPAVAVTAVATRSSHQGVAPCPSSSPEPPATSDASSSKTFSPGAYPPVTSSPRVATSTRSPTSPTRGVHVRRLDFDDPAALEGAFAAGRPGAARVGQRDGPSGSPSTRP